MGRKRASMPKMHLKLKKGALKNYAKRHHESLGVAIEHGLHSSNPLLKKRAVFAREYISFFQKAVLIIFPQRMPENGNIELRGLSTKEFYGRLFPIELYISNAQTQRTFIQYIYDPLAYLFE